MERGLRQRKNTHPEYDPFLVNTVNHAGTTVNVFDYWLTDNREESDAGAFGNAGSATDLRESGINKGQVLEFVKNPPQNDKVYPDPDGGTIKKVRKANLYTGVKDEPYLGIVKDQLGADGYPVLTETVLKEYKTQGYLDSDYYRKKFGLADDVKPEESLAYLFNPKYDGELSAFRKSYVGINGLFRLEDGYYCYDSQKNFASLDEDSKMFRLYGHAEPWGRWEPEGNNLSGVDRYDSVNNPGGGGIVAGGTSPNGQFFPFNTAPQVFKIRNDANTNQVPTLQRKKKLSTEDFVNHYFGLTMQTRFYQPTNGITNGDEMTYSFSGDDDIWIFIDGVLVADLGGIHDAVSVDINFHTGMVEVRTPKGETISLIKDTTLREIFKKVQGDDFNPSDFKEGTGAFADNTIHTMNVFYMERGNTDSNLKLTFNLAEIPASEVVKNDQDGDPIEGAKFELYAAEYNETTDTSQVHADHPDPICTVTTESDGKAILTDPADGTPLLWGDLVAKYGTKEFILRETDTPLGYRPLNTDVMLYYDEGIVFTRNSFDTGAWTDATLNVELVDDGDLCSGAKDQVYDGKTLEMGTSLAEQGIDFKKGILFAVPFRFSGDPDATLTAEQLKDPEGYKELPFMKAEYFHPMYGNVAEGWHVTAENINNKKALVFAAKQYNEVAYRNGNQRLAFQFDNLSGSIKERNAYVMMKAQETFPANGLDPEQDKDEYYTAINNQILYMNQHCKYLMGYYFAPGLTSLDQLTEDTTIIRLDGTDYNRNYAAALHIPNSYDTFAVQKLDYYGNRLTGAMFGLIQVFCEHPRDGFVPMVDNKGNQVTDTSGHPLYHNPLVLKNPNDIQMDENGQLKLELKSYDELMNLVKAGTLKLWDQVTTEHLEFTSENLGLDGAAFFPSRRDLPPTEGNTSTYLEEGQYMLLELEAPEGYSVNREVTHVRIAHDGIIADAKEANDGIRVGKSVGHPMNSMLYYCSEDPLDATLTYVNGCLESSAFGTQAKEGTHMGFHFGTPAEGEFNYRYKFLSSDQYYHRYATDVGEFISQGRNMFLYSDVGYIHMKVTQNQEGTPRIMELHGDHSGCDKNEEITLTIQNTKTNEKATYTIPANDGQLSFRLKEDEELIKAVSKNHGPLTEVEPGHEATAGNKTYILFQPNYTKLEADKDLSHLFYTTTVVQFQDQILGNLSITKNVDYGEGENVIPTGTDVKPFYFLMTGEFDRATKITLYDEDGKQNKTFNGVLNVRVIRTDDLQNPNERPSLEKAGTTIPKKFENGECLFHLPDGYYVDYVNIPENKEHDAYNLRAKVVVQIQLSDSSVNGEEMVKVQTANPNFYDSSKPGSGDQRSVKANFVNGVATIERDPTHSIILIDGYKQVDKLEEDSSNCFVATSRIFNAPVEAVYGANMTEAVPVTFSWKDGEAPAYMTGKNPQVVTKAGLDIAVDDNISTITDISYNEAMGHTISFYGEKQMAVIALYPGQTITLFGLGGMRYRVVEIGEGRYDKGFYHFDAPLEGTLSDYRMLQELRRNWFIDGAVIVQETDGATGTGTTAVDYFDSKVGLASGYIRPNGVKEGHETPTTQQVIYTNRRNNKELSIKKQVTGNLGDRNRYFAVDVTIKTDEVANPGPENGFTVTGGSKIGDGTTDLTETKIAPVTEQPGTYHAILWLKHEETLGIQDLPIGAQYEVEEITSGKAGEITVDMDGHSLQKYEVTGAAVSSSVTNSVETGVDGTVGKEDAKTLLVTVINHKDTLVDSGIHFDGLWYLVLLALVAGGLTWMVVRRHRRYLRDKGGDVR